MQKSLLWTAGLCFIVLTPRELGASPAGTQPTAAAAADNRWVKLTLAAREAFRRGQWEQADRFYASAAHERETAGLVDVELGRTLYEMGAARYMQGRCAESSTLLARGIATVEAVAPSSRAELIPVWQILANSYSCDHQFTKAERAYGRSLDLEQNSQAPRSGKLIEILADLGLIYKLEHRFSEAEAVFERAQKILDAGPQADAAEAALLMNNWGMLHLVMGRPAEAEADLRRGLRWVQNSSGSESDVEAELMSNLGALNVRRKQYGDAAVWFSNALSLIDNGASLPPGDSLVILRSYAACLRKMGKKGQAREIEARAGMMASALPPERERTMLVDVTQLSLNK